MLLRSASVPFEHSIARASTLSLPHRTLVLKPRDSSPHDGQTRRPQRQDHPERSTILSPASTKTRSHPAILGEPRKLLRPYELSRRVQVLCDNGELKKAIEQVKEAPLDAQNTIVWGGLIRAVMMAGKYKEAYRLFTDMKRRGFTPTTRTYGTILGGYAGIEDWGKYPLQLENVCNLYDQIQQYHARIKRDNPRSVELSHIPYTQLIQIFGNAQKFQRMYDVFNAMPSEGPLAPDLHTFTCILNAIANRRLSELTPTSLDPLEQGGESTEPSYHELMYKNASDAKLIWRQMLRASTKSPGFAIDSHAIHAVLKVLSRGRPSDQNFAFDIVHDYLGLSQPGQQAIPPKVDLHALTLESLLRACNNAKRYNLTLHYVQQVIDFDSGPGIGEQRLGLRRILNTRHMDLVLEAHAALASFRTRESDQALETLQWMLRMQAITPAPGKEGGIGPQIRPAASTYDLVLLACGHAGDWKGACRTFELMTGHDAAQFRGKMRGQPQQTQRSVGRALIPTPAFMLCMFRTAAKTHATGDIGQALNIFEHYGWDTFFKNTDPGVSRKQEKDRAFFAAKLAQSLGTILSSLLKSPKYNKATKARWEALRKLAASSANSTGVKDGNDIDTSADTRAHDVVKNIVGRPETKPSVAPTKGYHLHNFTTQSRRQKHIRTRKRSSRPPRPS